MSVVSHSRPAPSRIRSDNKRASARRSVVCVERVKNVLSVFFVMSSEVRAGLLTVQCIKTTKTCKVPEDRTKIVRDRKYFLNRKIAVRPP